jgi:hypothetical protein
MKSVSYEPVWTLWIKQTRIPLYKQPKPKENLELESPGELYLERLGHSIYLGYCFYEDGLHIFILHLVFSFLFPSTFSAAH